MRLRGLSLLTVGEVSASERQRMEEELNLSHQERRRVAVIRAKQGSAVWNDANLQHRELEFKEGRLLTRQSAFDALGFHVGLVSEASTEAHARVAERRVLNSVFYRHIRTASQLNRVLQYWGGSQSLEVAFKDVRQVELGTRGKEVKSSTTVHDSKRSTGGIFIYASDRRKVIKRWQSKRTQWN